MDGGKIIHSDTEGGRQCSGHYHKVLILGAIEAFVTSSNVIKCLSLPQSLAPLAVLHQATTSSACPQQAFLFQRLKETWENPRLVSLKFNFKTCQCLLHISLTCI